MLKKYSPIDLLFLSFCLLFSGVFLYEFVKFVMPYYSFGRFALVFLFVGILFSGYKSSFNFGFVQAKVNSFTLKWPFVKQFVTTLKDSRDIIGYFAFIVMCFVFLAGMLFDTGAIVPWTLVIFAIIYIIVKLMGFCIDKKIQKSDVSDSHTIKLSVLCFAVFFVIMKLICDSFSIPLHERWTIYIGFSALYIIGGFFTFFRYSFSLSGAIRPYNALSIILVLFLVGLLGYNNGLGDLIKEKVIPKPIVEPIVEEMDLPGIISDEAQLSLEEPVEVEYEQVFVSQAYEIEPGLSLGSEGEGVSNLQTVLGNLQYFIGEVSGEYDEDTRLALTDALITECDWPESTRGIFGPQAKECIDNLEISIPKK